MPMTRRSRVAAIFAALAVVLALAACGSQVSFSSSSQNETQTSSTATTAHTSLAKTKFVLHAGLAFGAFHRYIYKPARAGAFSHPFSHKLTIVKAGLAVAFIRHELRFALQDAQSSPTLRKLVSPITALESRWNALSSDIHGGSSGQSAITQDNGSVSSIEQQSQGAGQTIKEQAPGNV